MRNSKLIPFFYRLLRDELSPGLVEKLVIEAERFDPEKITYSNHYLAGYARELSERLLEKKDVVLDFRDAAKSLFEAASQMCESLPVYSDSSAAFQRKQVLSEALRAMKEML